jgi:hypothetical protein
MYLSYDSAGSSFYLCNCPRKCMIPQRALGGKAKAYVPIDVTA